MPSREIRDDERRTSVQFGDQIDNDVELFQYVRWKYLSSSVRISFPVLFDRKANHQQGVLYFGVIRKTGAVVSRKQRP